VAVIPQELHNKEKTFKHLSEILDLSIESLEDAYSKNKIAPFAPAVIKEDIVMEKAMHVEEASYKLPGVILESRPMRNYIYDQAGSHIFGYLGMINKNELTKLRKYGYQRQDLIGRGGLEERYDNYLKGRKGGVQLEVNNRGRRLRMLGLKEAISGKDIHLTLDIKIQKTLDELLSPYRGAAIVVDPRDGQILGMTSKPNFNPNIFLSRSDSSRVKELLTDENFPMFNRAMQGQYPPGSVFKVVVSAAGLESAPMASQKQFSCKGSYSLGKFVFRCWKKKGHGMQDIKEAIKNSCNVFFYQFGRDAGVDKISEYAKRFGYGRSTGIELFQESSGLVPGKLWKVMTKKEAWYKGDTVNYSIGQGYLEATPIQVVRMMAVIANKGRLVEPYLVKSIADVNITRNKPRNIKISEDTLATIKQGLIKVVNDDRGTGRRARLDGVLVAGKTGTAQAGGDEGTHAWFSGFAPSDEAKICVLVFLERGGKGGVHAAELAGKIFTQLQKLEYL